MCQAVIIDQLQLAGNIAIWYGHLNQFSYEYNYICYLTIYIDIFAIIAIMLLGCRGEVYMKCRFFICIYFKGDMIDRCGVIFIRSFEV